MYMMAIIIILPVCMIDYGSHLVLHPLLRGNTPLHGWRRHYGIMPIMPIMASLPRLPSFP